MKDDYFERLKILLNLVFLSDCIIGSEPIRINAHLEPSLEGHISDPNQSYNLGVNMILKAMDGYKIYVHTIELRSTLYNKKKFKLNKPEWTQSAVKPLQMCRLYFPFCPRLMLLEL